MLRPRSVIWILDEFIEPPGPKMVVCVEPAAGLFLRITTNPWWGRSVAITRQAHGFLRHDSYVECEEVLEFDDFLVQRSVDENGVLGELSRDATEQICAVIGSSRVVSGRIRSLVLNALQ